jgi:hypothetical protein
MLYSFCCTETLLASSGGIFSRVEASIPRAKSIEAPE